MGKNNNGPSLEFNPEDRKKYLLGLVNKKKRKAKEAEEKAKEELREARRERRAAKKEHFKEIAKQLCEKQAKVGVEPLPFLKEKAGFTMNMIEVDAENPTAPPKESVIDISSDK